MMLSESSCNGQTPHAKIPVETVKITRPSKRRKKRRRPGMPGIILEWPGGLVSSVIFWVFGNRRGKRDMWGLFAGFARKQPPHMAPTTADPRETIFFIL